MDFDAIEALRAYGSSLNPRVCSIEFLVPASDTETAKWLKTCNISFKSVEVRKASPETAKKVADGELADSTETALSCDSDAMVVNKHEWFPYIEDLEELGLFLTDAAFLKRQCEIFTRGYDVPWAFSLPIWNLTWTGFYHMTERPTFQVGFAFLNAALKKGVDGEARETGRSLLYNRLPNICFTRDRLLFFEIQRLRARRAKWQRQEFKFEIAYYLNFYYPLLYGGFDQLALLVSQTLKLGLAEKSVGATYKSFLDALQAKNPAIHAVFTDAKHSEFIRRIGALRHYASHRGSLMPSKLLEKPDREPTNEELDAEIANVGMDYLLNHMPEGELRDSFRETFATTSEWHTTRRTEWSSMVLCQL